MASPLYFLTSKLLTRSSLIPFRPMPVSAYRFLSFQNSTHHYSTDSSKVDLPSREILNGFGVPCCTTIFDQWPQSRPKRLVPLGSISFVSRDKDKCFSFNVNTPGLGKTESDEELCVFLYMPGAKKEDVKACVTNHNDLEIKGNTHEVSYRGSGRLPDNIVKISSDMKGEMKDGMFKLTLPKIKGKELKTSIIKRALKKLPFTRNFRYKLTRSVWCTFHGVCATLVFVLKPLLRLYVLKKICPEPFNSVSIMYEREKYKSLRMSYEEGLNKMELITDGACVSLNMPELKIEDVKSYFKHDAFFIEGKTKTESKRVHYFTCIRLPKNILKKRKMITTEMQDGMYKATLPYERVEININ